jgi:hypothetical protein
MQTTQRPIIVTPLVGLTEREWLIVAEAVRDAANATAGRLMKERQQRHTQQEEEPQP